MAVGEEEMVVGEEKEISEVSLKSTICIDSVIDHTDIELICLQQ